MVLPVIPEGCRAGNRQELQGTGQLWKIIICADQTVRAGSHQQPWIPYPLKVFPDETAGFPGICNRCRRT